MSLLSYEMIETQPNPDTAVIWLHGLGANGFDFVPIVPELNLPDQFKIRFIFPHAPQLPVTINGGMMMPAWYDILEMSIERKVDLPQIEASARAITALIEQQIEQGIASERIILAGFSQGGAVAYHAALNYDKPLGGLMSLSSYVATEKTLSVHPENQKIPVHVFHGTMDEIVPEILGQRAVSWLKEQGLSPQYKTYPMAHSVHPSEVTDISQWLQACLS